MPRLNLFNMQHIALLELTLNCDQQSFDSETPPAYVSADDRGGNIHWPDRTEVRLTNSIEDAKHFSGQYTAKRWAEMHLGSSFSIVPYKPEQAPSCTV